MLSTTQRLSFIFLYKEIKNNVPLFRVADVERYGKDLSVPCPNLHVLWAWNSHAI